MFWFYVGLTTLCAAAAAIDGNVSATVAWAYILAIELGVVKLPTVPTIKPKPKPPVKPPSDNTE